MVIIETKGRCADGLTKARGWLNLEASLDPVMTVESHRRHMASPVYFTQARGTPRLNMFGRLEKLVRRAGLEDAIAQNALTAVKVHWGEKGNAAFVPSFFVRHLVSLVRSAGGLPFVTDTNTLYRGSRHNAVDNLETARDNGFCEATLGAPVVIADGLTGMDYREVGVAGEHLQTARIASAIADADAMVVVSHVKGHMVFGFGGALKNLGMGCSAAAAKQSLHADVRPVVDASRCNGCGQCQEHCAFGAITMERSDTAGPNAAINLEECAGCGECLVVCPAAAIPIDWGGDDGSTFASTQEKTSEYARAAIDGKEKTTLYVSFLTNITPDCDCCSWSDAPIVPDIGFLASRDPVAIDMASVDLVNAAGDSPSAGADRLRAVHDIDYMPTLTHAARMGLGSLEYTLVEI